MQTKQEIQQLLASAGVRPNKRLGQHFLIDLNLMRLLVDSSDIKAGDIVLEVGCGTGSLTEAIAEKAGAVVAVEADATLVKIAKSQLSKKQNAEIINADILKSKNTINPEITEAVAAARKKLSGRFLLVSNLPYNVASPVMLNLIAAEPVVEAMYVTVQKEVAERMAATAGNKSYGILSIILAAAGDVKLIRVLKPSVFWPQPQVDSAMISFVYDKDKAGQIEDIELFGQVINLFMGHRRKTLKACTKLAEGRLSGIENWSRIFESCGIDPQVRPEQLAPENYIALANRCTGYLDSE